MSKSKQPSIKSRVDSLYHDAIRMTPVDIDWREAAGEDCEGWTSYEPQECEECGEIIVCSAGQGNERHCDMIDVDGEHDPDNEDEDDGEPCKGHIPTAEGPMMSYWYSVEIANCREAAKQLKGLPVCVVEMQDGQTGLALTGGGMDLSWQICEAFIRLGQLPPLHFAGRLPAMGGMTLTDRTRLVLAAAERSAKVSANWALQDADRIRKLRKQIALEAKARGKGK